MARSDGYLRLPLPDDLPVIVAVRMSLSFPVLLSAVPLHAVDYRKSKKTLERCWFSDGGISSNFPILFFDAALPKRPTFGLDLGPTGAGLPAFLHYRCQALQLCLQRPE